jgi:hypothetical protein
MRISLASETGETYATGKTVKPPSANAAQLVRVATQLLAELAPTEAVTALTVVVYPLRPYHLGATQLTLIDSEDRVKQGLQEVLRQLRERFGEAAVTITSLLGKPQPVPVQVMTEANGRPRTVIWGENAHHVVAVQEAWRTRRSWWNLPVERDYLRVETADAGVRVVFWDRRSGQWMMERGWSQ